MEKRSIGGYIYAFLSYVMWGFLPIFWKQLHGISATNLLMIRVAMTVVTLMMVVFVMKKPLFIHYLKDKKTRVRMVMPALLIGVNWGVFVYAINVNQVLQASLGYYIGPLLSIFLGIFFLKEKLTVSQKTAIGFAAVGVGYLTVSYGAFPWIAAVLALSFSSYGLMKKLMQLDSLNSLLLEGIYVLPFTLIIMYMTGDSLNWVNTASRMQWVLVVLAGVVTVTPLVLFAEGAKRIPLSAVGFLQYIAPTLMLFVGVVMYGEAFTTDHAVAFGFIWTGLAIYSVSIVRQNQQLLENNQRQSVQ